MRFTDEGEYRQALTHFYVNMSCLLNMMIREYNENKDKTRGKRVIAECLFHEPDYEISMVCRSRGIRPLLAYIRRPWPHSVYLGRINKDGTIHIFNYGIKVFFHFLIDEDILDRFTTDLDKTLDYYLLGEKGQKDREKAHSCRECNASRCSVFH